MQYHKIPLIAAVVFMASLSCTNNTQQRAVEHPNELSEETHLSPTDLGNSFEWPEGIKMGLSLSFDDARPSQIDKGIPLFDKYNVKGTFYIIPDNMKGRMDKWRQAVANGHEVGNHTILHPCTGNYSFSYENDLESFTLEMMKKDMEAAGLFIKNSLGVDAVSFAYPCGQTFVGEGENTQSYVPLVASLFETGRGWLDEGPNDPAVCDMAQLLGMKLDGKSFREVKRMIESAKSTGKWLILVGHEMDRKGEQTSYLSTLEAICKYATDPANGIWIDNIQNIASYVVQQRKEMLISDDLSM